MGKLDEGVSIDFSGVEVKNFDPVPAGNYLARIEEVDSEAVSSNDNKMWNWTFVIEGGDHDGSRVWANTNLEPVTSLWFLRMMLEALEVPEEDLEGKLNVDPQNYVGVEIGLKVAVKPAIGEYKARNEVKGFIKASDIVTTDTKKFE